MLIPIFSLKLNQKVFPRLVTVGKYDGEHPCLTGATNGGKVFLHTPHQRTRLFSKSEGVGRLSLASQETDMMSFSFGQHVTALEAGQLSPELSRDILVIGSQTNILAYDVEKNSELFYKDLPDGANNIVIGQLGTYNNPLALVGGNCAIKGFDYTGEDVYWTVTGDNVCSMALLDFTSNHKNELMVGSEDYEIRVFEDDELLMEMSEVDVVSSLCSVQGSSFAYALINGMVGMYDEYHRIWRTKSKSHPMCIHAFDINDDGVPELVTGWASGRVDIRSIETGNILHKDTFGNAIAGIVQADYRMDGKEELICCSVDGEIRGYMASQADGKEAAQPMEHVVMEQLNQKKQELLLELKNFEMASHHSEKPSPHQADEPLQSIPASTLIKTEFKTVPVEDSSKATPGIQLTVEVNNGATLRAVAIFADGLFEGESLIIHPPASKLSSTISVPIYPEKDIPSELQIKTFVGNLSSSQLHVFEAVRALPRFALYIPCGLDTTPSPQGCVVFNLLERLDRVLDWFKKNFLYGLGDSAILSPSLHVAYMSLRTKTPLIITVEPTNHGMTTIRTDDMDLVGDLVASLASHFSIEDLSVMAEFPHQMKDLSLVLDQVEELQKTRQQLTTEMADNSSVIGNLVVRAEDARMMNHMGNMKKAYNQLYQLNRDLMMGYKIRSNNHMQLLECLKIVNQGIQRAGRLRVGRSKTKVIAACRGALKNKDHEALYKAIRYGVP